MAKPVEKQNLSVPFFVLAGLVLVGTAWAFCDEFVSRRPWQKYQRVFADVEKAKLERDLAVARSQLSSEGALRQRAELQQQLHLAEDEAEGIRHPDHTVDPAIRPSRVQALKRRDELASRVSEDDLKLKFAKSEHAAAYYQYRRAGHLATLASTARERSGWLQEQTRRGRQLAEIAERVAKAGAAHSRSKEELQQAEIALAAFDGRVRELREKLAALEKPVAEIERKLAEAAARPSTYEQYWIPALGAVDRCQNCHVAVDRCGFSRPREIVEAFKREQDEGAVARRFCVSVDAVRDAVTVHDLLCEGADQVPTANEATESLGAEELTSLQATARDYCGKRPLRMKWIEKDGRLWATPEALKALRRIYEPRRSTSAGQPDLPALASFDVPAWAQSHPSRIELLGRAHPVESYGCAVCHGGDGPQTKGVGRFGVEPPQFDHGYDNHYSERPLYDLVSFRKHQDNQLGDPEVLSRQKQLVESQCARCHTNEQDLQFAPSLSKGRKLVAELACYGCHPIDAYRDYRKPGPRLTGVGQKLTPEYLAAWIRYPREVKPRTRMPDFWPTAIDREGKPKTESDAFKRREKEADAIVAFLWANSATDELPGLGRGDAARGKALFDAVGCRGCHVDVPTAAAGADARSIAASAARDFAPNLSEAGIRLNNRWTFTWIKNPAGWWPSTRMPSLRLSDAEASDLVAYLSTLTEGKPRQAPDEPRPGSLPKAMAVLAEEGKKYAANYGCFGCHEVKGLEELQRIGPDLNDFGRKPADQLDYGDVIVNPREQTWYNWVDLKLRHPRAYAYEIVNARMPQFDLSDEEVPALMVLLRSQTQESMPFEYVASRVDRRKAVNRGEKVVENLGCRNCHIVEGRGGLIREVYMRKDGAGEVVEDGTRMAPPLLNGNGFRTQPPWLYAFLRQPIQLRPWLSVRMPTFPLAAQVQTVASSPPSARDRASELAEYFSAAADRSFPFALGADQAPPRDYLLEAGKLFGDARCVVCHILQGKQPVGQLPAQMAPDLGRAPVRLRPEWIESWLADPQVFVPGTRMPTFFVGGSSPFANYFGGDAKKQIRALRDYVVNLPPAQAAAVGGKPSNEASVPP